MPLLTFGMAWFGYSLLAWGVATLRGCNVTWTQIAWPGKWSASSGCNADSGGSTTGNAPGSTAGTSASPTCKNLLAKNGSLSRSQATQLQACLKTQYGSGYATSVVKTSSGYSVVAAGGNATQINPLGTNVPGL